ncbi:MAG: decaprenyl-phosphate phosphoribosyltransferase [Chloroflexi bacterium]|nr:decaprenyl-phosphate phosphoribosyltransferase [Chloroflexota bacterium]
MSEDASSADRRFLPIDRPGAGVEADGLQASTAGPTPPSLARSLFLAARPRQWAKNALVVGAPATAGVLLEPVSAARTAAAFVAFCLVASGVYYVNDLIDRAADRGHPIKRRRPIAAGHLSPGLATGVAILLLAAGVLTGAAGAGTALAIVLLGYVALALAYAFVLRGVVLLDLAALTGGFVLRAVAGGVAVGVPLSSWFLIVVSFGSLFIATGKRHAEYLGVGPGSHRSTLASYSEPYLRYVQNTASTVAIAAYCLWAFEGAAGGPLWSGLSIVPFVLGTLRYALLLESGRGGSPEDLILDDAAMLSCGLVWFCLVLIGVHLG